jgi:hypothetical protein
LILPLQFFIFYFFINSSLSSNLHNAHYKVMQCRLYEIKFQV